MILSKVIPVLLFVTVTATAAGAEVVGKARVIDGATLEVGSRTVRLYGIDAPTEAQSCTQDGKSWPCGREALFALVYEVGKHWLTCEEKGRDREDRILALCRVGGKDLGRIMVAQGWALADRRVGTDYVPTKIGRERPAWGRGAAIWWRRQTRLGGPWWTLEKLGPAHRRTNRYVSLAWSNREASNVRPFAAPTGDSMPCSATLASRVRGWRFAFAVRLPPSVTACGARRSA